MISGEQLDGVVRRLTGEPILAVGWALFVAAFTFFAQFFVTAPERYAELDVAYSELSERVADGTRVERIYSAVYSATSAVSEAGRFYRAHVANKSTREELPPADIAEGLRIAGNARRTIATAIGELEGTTLHDNRLASQLPGLKSVLESGDALVDGIEAFFAAYAAGNRAGAPQRIIELNSDANAAARDTAAMLRRVENWSESASTLQREALAKAELLLARQRSMTVSSFVAGASLIYIAVFLVYTLKRGRNAPARAARRSRRPPPNS